jgi:uncharacterized Zn finger protein
MGEQIPFPGGQQQQQIRINVNDLTDIVCDECGNRFFRQAVLIKRLSPLVSPSGEEKLVPMPIFRCDDCGHVNDQFLPPDEQKEDS